MAPKILVVTAANDAFMGLLRGLVDSLQPWVLQADAHVACLDVGLAPVNLAWMRQRSIQVVEPGWDMPVHSALRSVHPHWRALTARPFLPKYFPGFDVYVWIDADAWIQEESALDWLVAAASAGSLAIVPEADRAYRLTESALHWRLSRMRACFGDEAQHRLLWETYFNAGVFALRSDVPHWSSWARWFMAGTDAAGGKLCCDQSALNHAIWKDCLDVTPLPATCNWLCHLALPTLDHPSGRFLEPLPPRRPIGILHLTGHSKHQLITFRGHGLERQISLHHPG